MNVFNLKTVVKIKNMESIYARYVVARISENGELWFYGEYDDDIRANEVACELGNGIVFDAVEV